MSGETRGQYGPYGPFALSFLHYQASVSYTCELLLKLRNRSIRGGPAGREVPGDLLGAHVNTIQLLLNSIHHLLTFHPRTSHMQDISS